MRAYPNLDFIVCTLKDLYEKFRSMSEKLRKRVIAGIALINLSIFLLSAFLLTRPGSFFWEGPITELEKSFLRLMAREGWDNCLFVLLCTSLCSWGIYLLSVRPDEIKED
ncbi:MAG: hypothetical protein EBY43_02955 [Opitutae bacterium]|nr:hypothetical protein [Opitutae bacterium]